MRFLEVTRQRHCEYFANATVLLLRAASIPARYATGYPLQGWSDLEQACIIRQRHAHAWARHYLNGNWHDLDTTPGQWAEIKGEQSSILEPLSDLLSWLQFGFDRWRSGERNSAVSAWWLLILAPLVIYVGWWLRFSKRRRTSLKDTLAGPDRLQSLGADSSIRRTEQHFLERALERKASESLLEWIKRLEREGLGPEASQALRTVVSIHYRFRFDPSPVAPVARDKPENDVTTWLSMYSSTRGGLRKLGAVYLFHLPARRLEMGILSPVLWGQKQFAELGNLCKLPFTNQGAPHVEVTFPRAGPVNRCLARQLQRLLPRAVSGAVPRA